MADNLYLIPKREQFPFLALPIFVKTVITSNDDLIVEEAANAQLEKLLKIDRINVIWHNNSTLHMGSSDFMSETIRYNKIVGIDPIDLYVSTDTYSEFDYNQISENGFITTGALSEKVPSIETQSNEIDMGLITYKLDEVFQVSSYLLNRYGFLPGCFLTGYGISRFKGPGYLGMRIYIPRKRDLDSTVIRCFKGKTQDQITMSMIETELSLDPQRNKFDQIFTTTLKIEDEMATIGCLLISSHLIMSQYNATAYIAGVSMHNEDKFI